MKRSLEFIILILVFSAQKKKKQLHLNQLVIECVCSRDQKPYLHNETKGEICIKIEFNPQKSISLLQHGRRFFVYFSNMAAVTSWEHTLLDQHNTHLGLDLLAYRMEFIAIV